MIASKNGGKKRGERKKGRRVERKREGKIFGRRR